MGEGQVRPKTEGRRHAHLGIKSSPVWSEDVGRLALLMLLVCFVGLAGEKCGAVASAVAQRARRGGGEFGVGRETVGRAVSLCLKRFRYVFSKIVHMNTCVNTCVQALSEHK